MPAKASARCYWKHDGDGDNVCKVRASSGLGGNDIAKNGFISEKVKHGVLYHTSWIRLLYASAYMLPALRSPYIAALLQQVSRRSYEYL